MLYILEIFNKYFKPIMWFVLIAFVLYKLYQKFFDNGFSELSYGKLSRSEAELKNIAETQFSAMTIDGTDEDNIFDSLEGLNKNDLIYVYNKFGKRKYSFFGESSLVDDFFQMSTALDLFGWYRREIDTDSEDWEKIKTIWAPTGLNV